MFYGTSFLFRILYFLTAMSPAYVLFTIQIYTTNFNNSSINQYINLNFPWFLIGIIFFFSILGLVLKELLKREYQKMRSPNVLTEEQKKEFAIENFSERNGNVVSFLLSNVIPVVLILESSVEFTVTIFFGLQFLLFILSTKSSDIFPNILLIIYGVEMVRMKNEKYLLILKTKENIASQEYIYLGTSNLIVTKGNI